MKDYKVASGILKQSADLYKNHNLLQGPQKDMLRLNLMASLTDPNTIKSLVSDFEGQGLNFSDIPLDDIEAARNMIADRVMNSYSEVAAQGKAEYDASRNPANPSNATDKNAAAIQGMMQAQIDSGDFGLINVSSNVQLKWSPANQGYVKMVRSSASGSWKVQQNSDGNSVVYLTPSHYK